MIPYGLLIAMGGGGREMVLSITDSTPTGHDMGASESGFVVTSSPTTTTVSVVSGGIGPYNYAWTLNGTPASSGPYTVTSEFGATTAFNGTVAWDDADSDESWRCRVTDTGDGNKTKDIYALVRLTWSDTS